MAILVVFKTKFGKDKYEVLRKEVQWEKQHPAGGIMHAIGFDDKGGSTVVDLWESAELMNAFVEKRLMPAFKKFGMTPPEVTVLPAYNINAYPAMDKHRLKG